MIDEAKDSLWSKFPKLTKSQILENENVRLSVAGRLSTTKLHKLFYSLQGKYISREIKNWNLAQIVKYNKIVSKTYCGSHLG
jgi:hypothetical protein